jgi:hypothetical protein
MTTLSAIKVVGPKTVNSVSSIEHHYRFDATDFYSVLSATELSGPFSLEIDIDNELATPCYFGIQIETSEGISSVGDRKHLGFIPQGTRILFSGASIPQLANIEGEIASITIIVYSLVAVVGINPCIVYIRLNTPKPNIGSLAHIGYDMRALSMSGIYTHSVNREAYSAVLGNHVLTTRWSYTPPSGGFAVIEYIYISLLESIAIAFTSAIAAVSINGIDVARIFSQNSIGFREARIETHIEIRDSDTVVFQTANGAVANATYRGNMFYREYL